MLEFEKSLATCADMVEQLGLTVDEKAKMDIENAYMLMMVRGIAHLCGKGLQTFEKKAHEDMNAIMKLFF